MQGLNPLDGLAPGTTYGVLFLAGFIETAFPPFPGDALTVAASFALAQRGGSLVAGLALSCSGSYLGGLTLWAFGRRLAASSRAGSALLGLAPGLDRAVALLARRGVLLVVVSRFIPGLRSLILLAAGYGRMPLHHVAWALGVAVALWQSIVVGGGYLVGRNWVRVVTAWGRLGLVLLVVAALGGYAAWRRARRACSSGGGDDSS
ncbi:MAG: VTT domain-containing protein [Candidatus Eisenbacteria bacterium]|nr:VTT domain-containing protein [Candidatus Eisenbacteria bacterium]